MVVAEVQRMSWDRKEGATVIFRRPVKRMDLALRYRERKARGECVACSTDDEPVPALPNRVWCAKCTEAKKLKRSAA